MSDIALAIIAHAPGSPERIQALRTAATTPELFAELDAKFPGGKASDAAIRSYLLTQRFIPAAADTAIRSYRETIQLVVAESGGYVEEAGPTPMSEATKALLDRPANDVKYPEAKGPMLQEVFHVDEGPVTLSAPSTLSPESYQDVADRLAIFLRGLKRRSEVRKMMIEDAGKGLEGETKSY